MFLRSVHRILSTIQFPVTDKLILSQVLLNQNPFRSIRSVDKFKLNTRYFITQNNFSNENKLRYTLNSRLYSTKISNYVNDINNSFMGLDMDKSRDSSRVELSDISNITKSNNKYTERINGTNLFCHLESVWLQMPILIKKLALLTGYIIFKIIGLMIFVCKMYLYFGVVFLIAEFFVYLIL